MKKDDIGNRMKEYYENRSKTFLTRRIPVIIRIDGKNFGTYTKSLEKPFDKGLIEDMNETAIYLCKNIQGAKCAYVQSDEISILVTDFDELTTDAWFDYNVQKMCSVSASLATGIFNKLRLNRELTNKWDEEKYSLDDLLDDVVSKYTLANFDSRCFNIPKEDIANYFLWRQQDCVRNSIFSVAQSLYSHKELNGKNSKILQEMIFQKGINWNDFSVGEKKGRWIVKNTYIENKLMYNTKNIPFPLRSNLDICNEKQGDIIYNSERKICYESVIAKNEDTQEEDLMLVTINNPTIRSKWEVVETPEKFNYSHFETYLK